MTLRTNTAAGVPDVGELERMLEAATPGPWVSDGTFMENGDDVRVALPPDLGVPGDTVCECWRDDDIEERVEGVGTVQAIANARLIALAPSLAAEVIALRKRVEDADALAEAVTAIANKADGRKRKDINGSVCFTQPTLINVRAALATYCAGAKP